MDKLLAYLNGLSTADQIAFAESCTTSVGYLRKAISVGQELNTKVCVKAERHSGQAVRRWDLRPDDWHEHWPELVGVKGAPLIAKIAA